ncbi:hypothetical protein G7046_g5062 [Stylonectria norvegica]|nr:hypothetical protein G7046_g5062 [Stylonectria norvegica]
METSRDLVDIQPNLKPSLIPATHDNNGAPANKAQLKYRVRGRANLPYIGYQRIYEYWPVPCVFSPASPASRPYAAWTKKSAPVAIESDGACKSQSTGRVGSRPPHQQYFLTSRATAGSCLTLNPALTVEFREPRVNSREASVVSCQSTIEKSRTLPSERILQVSQVLRTNLASSTRFGGCAWIRPWSESEETSKGLRASIISTPSFPRKHSYAPIDSCS